jgi:integrase
MPVGKITKSSVDRMPPNSVLWDETVVGFGIRRHSTHRRHYLLRFRFQGKQTFKRIGTHASPFTPETARAEALRLLGLIVSGTNPAQKNETGGETFGAEVIRYLTQRQANARPQTLKQLRLHLLKHCLPLHSLALAGIDRRRIAQLLGQIETGSGYVSRNRVRTSLSAFFSWLIREGMLDVNPVAGTGVADEGPSRDRVLTQTELAEVWRKGNDTIRLLILTGCRRDEIGKLRWSEVDFDRALLLLGPDRTKNKRPIELPLSPLALDILRQRVGPLDTPKTAAGNDASVFDVGSWSHCKAQLDKSLVGVAPWRLHDLRRSAATGMAELGVQPWIIENVLNHVSGHKAGVAGIYNRSKNEAPMRDALTKWADHVEALIVGPRKQPVAIGLMERAFAVARGGKIVPEEDLANLARQLTPLKRA